VLVVSYLKLLKLASLIPLALALSSCGSQEEIVSGLTQSDANQIIVVLQSRDITATKLASPPQAGKNISYSISVSSSHTKDALKILVDNKLPKVLSNGFAQVFPPGGGGLIPSSTQEKAQLVMALQGEIENMLLVLPGVVQARVVVVLPDATIIRDLDTPPPQATASVAVVYNPTDDHGNPSVSAENIKFLIASAVPDLSPSGVTVVMASNYPMKLVDSKRVKAKSVLSKASSLDNESASAAAPIAQVAKKVTESKLAPADKNDFLILLFGALAGVGLLFGLCGLVRSIMLRAKLTRLENLTSSSEVSQSS
jgi:type III secretion protein J